VWRPEVETVRELIVDGPDAKLDLAVKQQERDELPDRVAQTEVEAIASETEDTFSDGPVGVSETRTRREAEQEDLAALDISTGMVAERISRIEGTASPAAAPVPLTPPDWETAKASRRSNFVLKESPNTIAKKADAEDESLNGPLVAIADDGMLLDARVELLTCDAAVKGNHEWRDEVAKEKIVHKVAKSWDEYHAQERAKGQKLKLMSMKGDRCRDECCPDVLALSDDDRAGGVVKKMKLRRGITMDTGAHHNVIPKRMVGKRKIRPSEGSRRGMRYVGAGGEKICNEGEVDFPFESVEGHLASMVFQIAEVNKPLGSVAYFVDRDFRVVYDKNSATGEDMSYMIHKPTKKTYRFRRERNIWILDAIVDMADIFQDFSRPE
jgi:hypothetical protein